MAAVLGPQRWDCGGAGCCCEVLNQQRVVLMVGDMLLTNEKAKAAADLRAGSIVDTGAAVVAETNQVVQATLAGMTADSVILSAGLPRLFLLDYVLPPLSLATLWIILPFSLVLAAVGLIESLMALSLVYEITETRVTGKWSPHGHRLVHQR